MKRLRSLWHPGVVLGVIALIVGLSGTAIALPGKNKVTKNDIRANAVGQSEIATSAVLRVRDRLAGLAERDERRL